MAKRKLQRSLFQEPIALSNCSLFSLAHGGEQGNLAGIKEELMRQAVHSCEYCCTDILIFFDITLKKILVDSTTQVDFYFRKMGVDWIVDGKEDPIPDLYRAAMILEIETTNSDKIKIFKLYRVGGNC